jgi:hypothetical protein
MPRSVGDVRLWRALLEHIEARLVRTCARVAAALDALRIAVNSLDAARLSLDAAMRKRTQCRQHMARDLHARRGMLRRADIERISAAHSALDRTVADAQTSLAVARAAHDEACRTLSDARTNHGQLLRQREKCRLALDRLFQREPDDDDTE